MSRRVIGACEHGKPIHYRYPCVQCFGIVGYLQMKFYVWRTDLWHLLKRRPGR